jgi:selenide, water dikinase
VLRYVDKEPGDPGVLVGLDIPDDAAVYRLTDELALVQTVDFFTPIVDDPYAWGWIAAANALSDVYAMGGRPLTALNLVAWPRSLGFELLGRVLEGGSAACRAAGVTIVGGHSVDDPEPKYGLAVTGTVHPDRVIRTTGAVPGDDLVLTKALGTGIISSAIKERKAPPEAIDAVVAQMSELNAAASEAMLEVGVNAATDVTGFGLIGHLLEMLGDDLSARLAFESIPLLEGAVELAAQGILPAGSKRNHDAMGDRVAAGHLDDAYRKILFDAQTSGGLLMAVDSRETSRLLDTLARKGVDGATKIGSIAEGDGRIEVV